MIVVKVGGSLFDHPRLGPGLRAYLDSLAPAEVVLVPGGGPVADAVRELDRVHGLGEEASHWLAIRVMDVMGEALERVIAEDGKRLDERHSELLSERQGSPRSSSAPTGSQIVAQGVSPGLTPHNPVSPEGATQSAACVAPSGLTIPSPSGTQTSRSGLLSDAPLGRREDGRDKPGRSHVRVLHCLAFAGEDDSRPGALPHSWAVTSDSIAARVAVVLGAERLILLKSVDVLPGTPWDEAAARGWVDPHFPKVVAGAPFVIEVVNFRRVLESLLP